MRFTTLAVVVLAAVALSAQDAPRLPADTLLDRAVLKALDEELSGVAAKDHVGRLTQLHRVPASPGFHEAIEYVTGPAIVALEAALAEAAKGLVSMLSPPAPRAAVDARVPVRNPAVKGPPAPGGDWLREKAGAGSLSVAVARVPNSDDVTYEIANFIDGTRTVSEIRDAVSAEFEPLELKAVAEYLDLLARAGAVSYKP